MYMYMYICIHIYIYIRMCMYACISFQKITSSFVQHDVQPICICI